MIKNLIASGCSFTEDGIGGVPPSPTDPLGGNSFLEIQEYPSTTPKSWASMIAKKLQVTSFVNLAAAGHGNISIANNMLTLLTRFTYNPAETLILFNITDPSRLDIPCDKLHPEHSCYSEWPEKIIPFKYIVSKESDITRGLTKTIGVDQVEILTSNMILGMMSFLKQNNFNFKFLLMSDYTAHPTLSPVISNFSSNLVKLDPGVGMHEFSIITNNLHADGWHPSIEAHRAIADCVINSL
jgi:hypothetical protein